MGFFFLIHLHLTLEIYHLGKIPFNHKRKNGDVPFGTLLPLLEFYALKTQTTNKVLWHHLRQAGLEHRIRMLPEGLDAQVPKISPKMVVFYRCFGE